MQAATSALPNGGPSPATFQPQSGIASSSRPTTPFVPQSASTPTLSSAAPTPSMTHQMPPQQQQPSNAGPYGNYPTYAGQQQFMYQPNYYQQLPPRPSGGPVNGNGVGAYQPAQNQRYPDQYAQGFPPQPYYPFPQMGGPGPATMQNGYGYQPDYSQAYGGRPAYPSYPSQSAPSDLQAAQQAQSQSQPFSAGANGEHDNANPGPTDNGSYQQHPPPPTLPPPADYPASFQHPPPPPFPQQHVGHPNQGYPAYFPPGHPYAYGGGVGYAPPAYPAYPGYDISQQQHQQHPQHQQHNHQQQQPHPHQQQHFQQHQHSVPAIPQNHNRASSAASATTSSRLNPAAAGFTFIPAAKRDASVNGAAEKKDSTPVFASLAHSTTSTTAATGAAGVGGPAATAASLPNGHHAGGQASAKKWVQPVIANGEKFKGLKVPAEDEKSEANGSSGTGLGLTMDGSISTAPSEAKSSSTVATTPQQSNSTPAMSSSPTTATTPVSVRTPRAPSAEVGENDGEATILFSPQASTSPTGAAQGVLKFIGSPVSGYTSPPMSAHVPMQSFGQVQAQEVVRLSKKKERKDAVDAEPYKLVKSTPAVGVTGAGVFYAKKLERGIPEKYRREDVRVEAKEVFKAQPKAFGSRGAKVKIGVRGEKIPKRKGEQIVFGEIAVEDAIPKAPRPVQTAEPTKPISSASTSAGPTEAAASATKVAPAPPAAPKVKPSSWAALLHTGSTAPSTAASTVPTRAPSVIFSSPAEAGPSRLPASPSAEPTTPKSTASALPPTSTGPRLASSNRPSFNYAAAAAAAAGLTPQEELAKILAEGVKGKGKEVGVVPRGLINTGNMCFANTILQVLVYCTPFTDLLEELSKRLKADLGRKTPLLEAMIIFLREFAAGPGAAAPSVLSGTSTPRSESGKAREQRKDAFVPENVYDAMKENKRFDSMRRGHQEDAEEYLGFFLDTLHEELLYLISRTQSTRQINGQQQANGDDAADERSIQRPVSPSAETDNGDGWLEVGKKQKTNVVRSTETRISAITRLFGGTIRSHLRTPGAKDSVTLEPYQPLQLDVQSSEISSIADALKHLSAPEVVPGVWSASRKANVDATKQIYVETFPPVLMLHLKRFVYDSQARDVVKRSKPVAYGTELDIPAEIQSPGRKVNVKYRLFGVVYHHGTSASGGHYTVAVSRQDKAGWIHFDDESVTAVPTEQVIVSQQEADEAKEGRGNTGGLLIGGRERCAYLLFYQRVRAA